MYKVLVNGALMCDSRIEELALINPVVDLEENKAGSFSFTIPPDHPKYDAVMRRKSVIQVIVDEEIKFCGPCIEAETDFFKRKKIYCEGELTFFNDSIQRPARYQNITVRGLLEALVANHNAQVEESKWFKVGIVTVTDPNNSLYCYTNMESTMTCLKEDLLDDLGGILRIRYENGERYIDYLAESPNTNSQVIKLGKNLLDFKSNIDSSDIATAIIPLGKTQETSEIEGLETKLTIKSVNNGVDYVYNQDAVGAYGMITKTVEFSDVTNPSILKTKGEQYLADIQFENVVIEAKAVDLHMVDKEIEGFKLSDRIRVLSEPHGMNRYFRATKQTFNLNNPASDTITLGKLEYVGLSAQTNQVATQSKAQSSAAVNQAVENASQIIANAMGGYVVKTNDEILIMDTNDIATATKVWRWNINGLGYSRNGYAGPYELAMTMDGAIVANLMTTGILQSADGKSHWDLETGEILISGVFRQFDSNDTNNPSVEIVDNQVKVYGWQSDDKSLVGAVGSLHYSSTGRRGISMWAESEDEASIGVKDKDGKVYASIKVDGKTQGTEPPWIKNTVSGKLFSGNKNGITVKNGLITDWDMDSASGTMFSQIGSGITVKNGLITGWNLNGMSGSIPITAGTSSGRIYVTNAIITNWEFS